MTVRLINADDIVYESIDSSDTTRYEYYYGTGILAVRKEDIEAMQTIEPKTAHWIGEHTPFRCSNPECGHYSDSRTRYCAHCGSKMVEEQK